MISIEFTILNLSILTWDSYLAIQKPLKMFVSQNITTI